MIEEKKMPTKNAILLLKHVGYCIALKMIFISSLENPSLCIRIKRMIFEENEKKKEERNENLLTDLYECYLLLDFVFSLELLSICVPRLVKVASSKEKSEDNQKEVETALFTLSCIGKWNDVGKILFLEEINEIIQYNQEHRNLTRLAYQSAWQFLIDRLDNFKSLKEIIANELHFVKEARRELEELLKCVDWKRKKEDGGGKEAKEEFVLLRWLQILDLCFFLCKFWNEEYAGLIDSIARVLRATKENNREICFYCIYSFKLATENKVVKVEDLLNGGAVDAVLEEILQSMLIDKIALSSLKYMNSISERLKDEANDEKGKEERKIMKKKVIEKMEEEGYEDVIVSFHEKLPFLCRNNYHQLSLDISDYFVNI